MNVNASVLDTAYYKAGKITRSVLTVARILNVKPATLAKELLDNNANGNYSAEFTAEMIKAVMAEEARKAKENR